MSESNSPVGPATLDGYLHAKKEAPATIRVFSMQTVYCGSCGHAMMDVDWKHIETLMGRGYRLVHCLNGECTQFFTPARFPLAYSDLEVAK